MNTQLHESKIQPALREACLILDKLRNAGYTAYIVGGAVRDTLVEREVSDIDIATSATPQQVMEVFPRCIPTGLQHGTVTVLHSGQSYEVTTYRKETNYEDHRHPTEISFVNDIYEDLLRRDFTMNAMALDANYCLYDVFEGYDDLLSGRLRCVGRSNDRFEEDALRMLRAVRFSATYKLVPTLSLWRAIQQQASLLSYIAMERVSYEITRMLQHDEWIRGMLLLRRSQLLLHTKESLKLAPVWQELVIRCADIDLLHIHSVNARWAALFIVADLTPEEAASDLRALKLSNEQRSAIVNCISIHEVVSHADNNSAYNLQKIWLNLLLEYKLSDVELWLVELAPVFSASVHSILLDIHHSLKITSIKQLGIRGNDLLKWSGQPSGPWVKNMLAHIMKAVAIGQVRNDKQSIKSFFENTFGGE